MAKTKTESVTNIFDEMTTVNGLMVMYNEPRRIQHNNNERKFQLPLEFWGGSYLELSAPVENIIHEGNGASVPSFMLDQISILYISHRLYWQTGEGAEYQTDNEYQGKGWKSRLQVFCLLKEAEDFIPCVFTVGSLTAEATERAIVIGQRRIKTMLNRIGKGDREHRLFWMTLSIPETPTVASDGEKKKNIYPPYVLAPTNMHKMSDKDITSYLIEIYAGHDARDIFGQSLHAEGEQWALSHGSHLRLTNGESTPVSTDAVVLVDGSLHIPDLGNAKEKDWVNWAASIPGLFSQRDHASRAFGKLLRDLHLQRADQVAQWESWSAELSQKWDDLQSLRDSQNRAAEDRGLTADMSAMDEVEAHAAK